MPGIDRTFANEPTSYTTSTVSESTKVSVVLAKQSDWWIWIRRVQDIAINREIWDYVNPDGKEEAPAAPTKPKPSDLLENATSHKDLVENNLTGMCEGTGDLKPLVKCFISIGTGSPGKKAIEDNMLKLVSKTLPELATQTEHTEKNFIAKWRQHYDEKRYFRFNVDQGLQEVGLAEYQEQGLIEAATDGYLDHQAVAFQVRDCIQNLRLKQRVYTESFA